MELSALVAHLRTKEGYKNTRPIIASLKSANNSVDVCIQSIKDILSSKRKTAEMKLYSLRFLKDCFDTGNEDFIRRTEIEILPILEQIALDSDSKDKQVQYISDSSQENIKQLKNLFQFTLECIKSWKDVRTNKKENYSLFSKVYSKLKDRGIQFPESNKYFKQNLINALEKSRVNENSQHQNQYKSNKSVKSYKSVKSIKSNEQSKLNQESHIKITLILNRIKQLSNLNLSPQDQKQTLDKLNQQFDQILEEYIAKSPNFNENYINHCYSKLEIATKELKANTLKKSQLKQNSVSGNHKKDSSQLMISQKPTKQVSTKSNIGPRTQKPFLNKTVEQQKVKESNPKTNQNIDALKNIPEKFIFVESGSSEDQEQVKDKQKPLQKIQLFDDDLSTIKDQPQKNVDFGTKMRIIDRSQLAQKKQINQMIKNSPYNKNDFSVISQLNKNINNRIVDKGYFSQLPNKLGEGIGKGYKHNQWNSPKDNDNTQNSQLKPIRVEQNQRQQTVDLVPQSPNLIEKRVAFLPIQSLEPKIVSRIEMDYNNFSCAQNRILSECQGSSLKLFKESILGKSMAFFQNSLIYIEKQSKNIEVNGEYIVNLKLVYHTGKIKTLKSKLHNARQTDIWIKPISKINEKQYEQEIAIKILNTPLNLIKLSVFLDQALVECFLPTLFFSFVREGDIHPTKFDQIFKNEAHRIIRSPILPLNIQLINKANDFKKYFSECRIFRRQNKELVQLSFLYPEKQLVLLSEIVLYPNQKAQFHCLELIDRKKKYGRQLNDNLIFLFCN